MIRTAIKNLLFLCLSALTSLAIAGGGGGESAGNPYLKLEPLVVNLAPPNVDRYLQIGITYEADDNAALENMKAYLPIIRSRALIVLSTKTLEDVSSTPGKQFLMDQLLDAARYTLPEIPDHHGKGVKDVHLTAFVVQ